MHQLDEELVFGRVRATLDDLDADVRSVRVVAALVQLQPERPATAVWRENGLRVELAVGFGEIVRDGERSDGKVGPFELVLEGVDSLLEELLFCKEAVAFGLGVFGADSDADGHFAFLREESFVFEFRCVDHGRGGNHEEAPHS
uniref:(northern house mosquito) hypothetical protein n=1 Tax=Culex pipiens TaxID=7175 RepID=A0A8D8NQI9_CULPI